MRTNWGTRASQTTPDLLADYAPSVGAVAESLKSLWGHENSIPPRWHRSSFDSRVATLCRRICCWAATPFNTQARPRRFGPPTLNGGERSASRPTWTLLGPCQLCSSDGGLAVAFRWRARIAPHCSRVIRFIRCDRGPALFVGAPHLTSTSTLSILP